MDEKQLKTVVYVFLRTSIGRYEGVGWRPLPPPLTPFIPIRAPDARPYSEGAHRALSQAFVIASIQCTLCPAAMSGVYLRLTIIASRRWVDNRCSEQRAVLRSRRQVRCRKKSGRAVSFALRVRRSSLDLQSHRTDDSRQRAAPRRGTCPRARLQRLEPLRPCDCAGYRSD